MSTISKPAQSSVAAEPVADENCRLAPASAAAFAPQPLKFQRIIVPLDFSEHSVKAFQKALDFAQQFDAELILVHIVEQIIYPGDWSYPPLAMSDFAAEKRDEVASKLKGLTAGSGVRAQEIVRLGRAWQEVVEIAKEKRADLVVIATHGYTGLRHVLLGSVAEKIVRHAPCPVLTVRADDRDFS
jgi:nucleotide-binding universal stress UspA family protein